jgi:hypothetical protein
MAVAGACMGCVTCGTLTLVVTLTALGIDLVAHTLRVLQHACKGAPAWIQQGRQICHVSGGTHRMYGYPSSVLQS